MSTQPASMNAFIDEGMIVAMFVEIFRDCLKSPSGTALSALLTREDLTWQLVTPILLQEFVSLQLKVDGGDKKI